MEIKVLIDLQNEDLTHRDLDAIENIIQGALEAEREIEFVVNTVKAIF